MSIWQRIAQARAEPWALAAEQGLLLPRLDQRAVGTQDQRRPGVATPKRIVSEPERIIQEPCAATYGPGKVREQRPGVSEPRLALPFELSTDTRCPRDHIRHLSRDTGNAEARRIGNFDPFDVRRRDPPKNSDCVVRLSRDSFAVDQHIAACLAKAPLLTLLPDQEPGHLTEHVQRRPRRKPGKLGWGINLPRILIGSRT